MAHMSNVLGTVTHRSTASWRMAHAGMARRCCWTASQAAVHRRVDVQAIDAVTSTCFTGHKLYGPDGDRRALGARLEHCWRRMPPFLGGGDMISLGHLREVRSGRRRPAKFEAGTPPIIEAVGLHAAIDYVTGIGMGAIEAHERALVDHAMARVGRRCPACHAARPRPGSRRGLRLRPRFRASARPGHAARPRRHLLCAPAAIAPSRCTPASTMENGTCARLLRPVHDEGGGGPAGAGAEAEAREFFK